MRQIQFYNNPELGILVCSLCRYGIFISQLRTHLKNCHHLPKLDIDVIVDDFSLTPNMVIDPALFEAPQYLKAPVSGIHIYQDGILCRLSPENCSFVTRNKDSMRRHRSKEHKGSSSLQSGYPTAAREAENAEILAKVQVKVSCQRIFRMGVKHARLFAIFDPQQAQERETLLLPETSQTAQEIWNAFRHTVNHRYEELRAKDMNLIVPGAKDEADPWLRRTGWVKYLNGCQMSDLNASIASPEKEELDDPAAELTRKIENAIWSGMESLAIVAQQTSSDSSHVARMKIMQLDSTQTFHKPFETYQDPEKICDRVRPWQQVLMFFVRTQREHEWMSPQYHFGAVQRAYFQEMMEVAELQAQAGQSDDAPDPDRIILSPLQKAILKFCIELLNQRQVHREYEMALVCASAVLGVGHARQVWLTADLYPPVLSRLIKVSQLMVLQFALDIANEHHARDDLDFAQRSWDISIHYGDDPTEQPASLQSSRLPKRRKIDMPEYEQRSSVALVMGMVESFMQRGTQGPMEWFLDLRAYGMKIHYATTSIGHVNWRNDTTLEYKAMSFSMSDFHGMIHTLVRTVKLLLFEEVFRVEVEDYDLIPHIPWHQLYDDPSNGSHGWSFLQDQRTNLPVDGNFWFFDHIQKVDKRIQFIDFTAGSVSEARLRDWLRQASNFRAKLLVLIHMTGGQPARGPELLSLRHKNTREGGHRNLFIEDGLVVYVTKYHKGYQTSGDIKIIHRYLPREVGELVVWYLWLVVPFMQRIVGSLQDQTAISDHLWPAELDDRKWTTRRLSEEIKKVAAEALGHSNNMGVASYREIAIAISRKFIKDVPRHGLEADDFELEAEDEAADQQAGHSSHVAGMVYARESTEGFGAVADKRKLFRKVSLAWHNFLGFKQVTHEGLAIHSEYRAATTKVSHGRRLRLRAINATAALRRMMHADVSFRSEQAAAVKAVLRGDSQIIAVLPTGAGKSVLFMLPAWLESGGMTILVVPLLALRQDMISRCKKLGITCAVWDGRNEPDGATIVLLTPEMATKPEFMTFVQRVRNANQLDRIVIDECHVILNDQLNFRRKLQELGQLGHAVTQMLLLTATLPPCTENTLLDRMFWRREDVKLVRASTVRSNIAYSIVNGADISAAQRFRLLQNIVNTMLAAEIRADKCGKVVIMCESRGNVEDIANANLFPCFRYHSMVPKKEKENILEDFRQGLQQILVTTGAFGMGIDIPDVRAVISYDSPRSMLDYAQASGRGGRDGLKTYAIIMSGGLSLSDDPQIEHYMNPENTTCRRIMLDTYLDGDTSREGCKAGEESCDRCAEVSGSDSGYSTTESTSIVNDVETLAIAENNSEPDTEYDFDPDDYDEMVLQDIERQRARSEIVRQCRTQANMSERLRKQLERWKGRCGMCFIGKLYDQHVISRCKNPKSHAAEIERKRIQGAGGIRYGEVTKICFKCSVPRSTCDRFDEELVQIPGANCQYFGIVIAIVCAVRHGRTELWERALRITHGPIDDPEKLLAWYAVETEQGMTHLLDVFLLVAESL